MGLFKKEAPVQQPVQEEKPETKTVKGTVIAEGVTFEGDFVADELITIEGTVKGNIKSSVDTRIEKTGTHIGTMNVKTIHVDGNMQSDITCLEMASLGKNANFTGTLTTPNIEAAHGSTFNGNLRLNKIAGNTANSAAPADKNLSENN